MKIHLNFELINHQINVLTKDLIDHSVDQLVNGLKGKVEPEEITRRLELNEESLEILYLAKKKAEKRYKEKLLFQEDFINQNN